MLQGMKLPEIVPEGHYVQHFHNRCGLNSVGHDTAFVVVPELTLETSMWCAK
jgi:hypothetical protein